MPERNLVFVVDDDAMMLKSVARLLRQLGYESVLFPSAEAFENHSDLTGRSASFSTSTWAMFQVLIFGNVSKKRTFLCRSSTSPGTTAQPFAGLRINPGASPI